MKKAIYLLLIFVCMIMLLTACSSKREPAVYSSVDSSHDDSTSGIEAEDAGITADLCSEGLYIKRDNLFYAVDSQIYYTPATGSNRYDSIMGIGMLKEDDCPVLESQTDQLAIFSTVSDIQYRAISILKKGYCAQGIINATGHQFDENYQIFYKIASNQQGFDVLNGSEINNMDDLIAFTEENNILLHQEPASTKRYTFLFSENKTSIDAVDYVGTQATNYSLNIDTPSVLLNQKNSIRLRTDRTDEGCFYIDVSSLDAGYYAIVLRYGAVLSDHCFLIEIK